MSIPDRTVTAEAVRLHVDVAGLGSRMIAGLIDSLIQFAILFGILSAVGGGGGSTVEVVVVLLVVFLVVWVPATWLFEPDANLNQEEALTEHAIERGRHAVELFTEENQGGVGCVQCHGPTLQGGIVANPATVDDPYDVRATPNLTTVCGGPWHGHPAIHGLDDIYTTIEQGRGPIMPSWSIRFAGALNDQQINDIVTYIISIQDESVANDENVCTNPEAQARADEEFPDKPPATDNPDSQL